MNSSRQRTNNEGIDMINCVSGLVFLGTPFIAPRAQSYASIIGKMLARVDFSSSEIYETSPRELRQQRKDFVHIVNRQHIPLYCFFEQHRANIARAIDVPIRRNVSNGIP